MPTPRPAPPRPPLVVAGLGVIGLVFILGPVLALGVRVPWGRVEGVLAEPATHDLLRITLGAGLWTTLLTTLLGVPLALWIQHLRRGARLVRLLVLLPLAMPPVVAGLALSAALGRRGLTAPLLDATGLQFAFAFPGVILAHTFIALPFVVVTVDAALRQIDPEIPSSAASVGLKPGEVLRKVTLPAVAPALATGAGLAFARSLGEFGTTLTFAGSMPGVTRTMPLGIYLERETDPGRAYVLGALLITLAVVVLLLAALPGLLRREYQPRARSLHSLDTTRLRELTAPPGGGVPVHVGEHTLPANRVTAVVGPNGSGKTTLMRQIGSPHLPVEGKVVLLTQRPGLPTTTTAAGAVSMVTRCTTRTRELLDAAGLTPLHDVPVPALSGGQAAQVALVRALAARPAVLILDEPLAAIDIASTTAWRGLLHAAARDRTTILVTHDPLEVAGLSDYLLVLEGGDITAAGSTSELLAVPPNSFVSSLAGLNRMEGSVVEKTLDTVTIRNGKLLITGISAEEAGDQAVATFPPEATTLRLPAPSGGRTDSARNLWPGTIESIESASGRSTAVVTVSLLGEAGPVTVSVPVTRRSILDLGLAPGTIVDCVTKATAVTVHPHHPRS
ncbi:MAG: ABC transporter permease subunit [Corynebacterium sp.]|uniref:ATP-binding cassette domain-containing protein n=1 Tax=Corynebacterium sp. TaxID=1720 RepID=UPI0026DF3712|nr:ATP-binding cassette domain-containing protein [Corynebacterium sp.]MDO5670480.1 ABC transporter permease subunit [Corynebacterium sp.]